MRWQFFGLVLVGIVAAVCAAVLVATLKIPATAQVTQMLTPEPPQDVKIAVANGPVDRMTTITADMVTTTSVPPSSAPQNALRTPAEVIGQVLLVPVVKGQPFRKEFFAGSTAGVHMAATLPEGMRAMSVSLNDYSGLEGLLYPGSTVDVLASFDMRGKGDQEAGVLSTTILRAVEVLAIEDRTAGSPPEKEGEKNNLRPNTRRRVTLMVSPKQAEELQLAMEHGVISLAMRNPKEHHAADDGQTREMTRLTELGPTPPTPTPVVIEKPVYIDRPVPVPTAAVPEKPREEPKRPAEWPVEVIRGGEKSQQKFKIQERGQ